MYARYCVLEYGDLREIPAAALTMKLVLFSGSVWAGDDCGRGYYECSYMAKPGILLLVPDRPSVDAPTAWLWKIPTKSKEL